MKTWDSKIVDFLANYNTVRIKGKYEFCQLEKIMNSVGLTLTSRETFEARCASTKRYYAEHGQKYELADDELILEYANHKGVCVGWRSAEESRNWYGVEPLSVYDLISDLN